MTASPERTPLLATPSRSETLESQGSDPNVEMGIVKPVDAGGRSLLSEYKIVQSIFRDSIPVCVFWVFIEPVLLSLGQPAALSRDVQTFLRILILGAPGYVGFESLKKYLQCQCIMQLSTVVLGIMFPINIGLNVALIHHTSLGLWGSPTALSITYWLAFAILAVLTAFSPTHRSQGTWGGFQLSRIFHIKSCFMFLKLALPGILMVGTEWAAFEIVALCAGRLGALPLAAQSVIMTFDQILNTLPFGIGVAASNRVGNLIGARSAIGAKHAAHASAFLSVVVGAVVMMALLIFKDVCGYVMSDDIDVVRLVSKVMPLVASFQISDGLAGSCGGALRGQGQVVGLTVVGISEYLVVWFGTDWDLEVEKGAKRNEAEGDPIIDRD
ncbi:ethionine resistance protein [Paramarasmius palmivorus]|uniref:Ethionine resistance protein n=1 Tax=Paramarasmius palmivorus TaxID=297713 RepID=A0AAW0BJY3_9AGAR